MLKIKAKNAMGIFREIMGRIDMIEVKGDSVEHLFFVRTGIKQLLDGAEIVDTSPEKDKKEDAIKDGG